MHYQVIVSDDKQVLENILFEDRIPALVHVERRRKQGYTVTVKVVSLAYEFKKESNYGTY